MSKIKIQGLGPIQIFEEPVDEKLMILIGEQASGKSTIAKSIFFCKGISEEFKKFLMDTEEIKVFAGEKEAFLGFKKQLRTKFMEYFGTTKHMSPFHIKFTMDNGEFVRIDLKSGYANISFSVDVSMECKMLIKKVKEYYIKHEIPMSISRLDFNLWSNDRESLAKLIDAEVNRIFEQGYTSVFIPAGRSLLATNSEFFHMTTPNKYDILMNDFIERIMILQKQYSQSMEDIVKDRKKLSSAEIDFQSVDKAIELVKKILKGEYVNEKNGEKIYYENDKFVKLIQASSGQQEALWIVLLIFSIILNNQKVYMVIEEPEAHLFPTAQKDIMELITLMINTTGSRVIVTTHSPYILTAANLLMYSSYVESNCEGKDDVVPIKYRLSSNEISAYLVKNHSLQSILDQENHMIDPSTIDEVSEMLNGATDKLIEKELSNGL